MPGELRPEPVEHVVEGPGHDEGVVEDHHGRHGKDCVAQPLHDGGELGKYLGAGRAAVLTEDHLHEVERESAQQQADAVWDEEGAAAIVIADIGEPPDIAETNSNPKRGEEILKVTVPFPPAFRHFAEPKSFM